MSATDARGELLFDGDAPPVAKAGADPAPQDPPPAAPPSIAAWLAQWGEVLETQTHPGETSGP